MRPSPRLPLRAEESEPAPTGARKGRLAARPSPPSLDHVEEAHPAEVGELRLMRVEHEPAGVGEVDLQHPALPLALDDRVGVLPVIAGPGRLVPEELSVQV